MEEPGELQAFTEGRVPSFGERDLECCMCITTDCRPLSRDSDSRSSGALTPTGGAGLPLGAALVRHLAEGLCPSRRPAGHLPSTA